MKGLITDRYQPLKSEEVEKIHHSSMQILEKTGVEVHNPEALKVFDEKGAMVDYGRKRVKIPKSMVEDMVAKAPKEVLLCGREKKNDLFLSDRSVYSGTGGLALNVLDLETGQRRPSTLEDLKKICRLVDALENLHFVFMPVHPNELPLERIDVKIYYASFSNTTKHITGGVYDLEGLRDVIKMAEQVAGEPQKLRERPFVSFVASILSPLKMDAPCSDIIMEVARSELPLTVFSQAVSTTTAPITLSGSIVLLNAEILSGIVLAELIRPGTPVLYGSVATISDLRSLGAVMGAIENGLIDAGAALMAQLYSLPFYAIEGGSDSKIPDVQAGYEKALSSLIVALTAANYLHGAAGLLESGMTISYEQCVIDDEIYGMVMRAVRGIEVNEDTLAQEVIESVGPGGNFFTEEHTIKHLRSEFFMPKVSDRSKEEQWRLAGAKDGRQRAKEKAQEILQKHRPLPIPKKVEEKIKASFEGLVL